MPTAQCSASVLAEGRAWLRQRDQSERGKQQSIAARTTYTDYQPARHPFPELRDRINAMAHPGRAGSLPLPRFPGIIGSSLTSA